MHANMPIKLQEFLISPESALMYKELYLLAFK